jgi:hypothetical protein
VFAFPADAFPGADQAKATAQDGCATRWVEQGGKATDPLDVVTVYPTATSWSRGNHSVTCLLTPR